MRPAAGRRGRRCVVSAMLLGLASACADTPPPDPPAPPADSAPPTVAPIDRAAPLTPSTWDTSLGDLLLLPPLDAIVATQAIVLRPGRPLEADPADTLGLAARLSSARMALFARRGLLGEETLAGATLHAAARAGGLARRDVAPGAPCVVAPRVDWVASSDSAAATLRGWLVALPAGVASAVPLDSIEGLATRDSATLAAGLARLASGVAEDSASVFRGLPMTVVRAYRSTRGAPGLVVADLVRRVPQEDQPLVEQLTLVVEQAGTAAGSWRVVWSERLAGREEEVLALAPLVLLERGAPAHRALLLARELEGDPEVVLLEHRDGEWSVRWTSPVTACGGP
jgi:hypothetical protein